PTPLELLLYAHGNKHGSWVAVLEKAAARLLNSEAGLLKRKKEINILHGGDPGVALKLLTGEKVLSLSGREADLVEKLAVASQWGLPLVCASEPLWTDAEHDARGVYYSHLYMLKYDPLQKEVIVRNPWGGTKRAEPSHADGTPLDGAADGAFRMSLADFRKSFPYVWAVVP
ncbi:MAG TPA: C2 family cysteine protease, partial [Candidatus Obscuribacterales bacterium]